jgi:ribose transport system substrate-binding protein
MATLAAVAAIGLAGCASPDFTLVASGVDTSNKALVMFMPSTANVYLAAAADAARAEATRDGYTLTVIENNFDQVEQDQQVQQYLASGGKPAAFLWWPATSAPGSTRIGSSPRSLRSSNGIRPSCPVPNLSSRRMRE